MRILLIQAPVSARSPHSHLAPPLGLAYVAAHLLEAGHVVELVDLNVAGFNPHRINLILKRFQPQGVGISSHTETYPNAVRIADQIKEAFPDVPIVLGGPHATLLPKEALTEPSIDFVVLGEGERTAVELFEFLSDSRQPNDAASGKDRFIYSGEDSKALKGIFGLGFKDRIKGPTLTQKRDPLDVNEIKTPARQLLSLQFYDTPFNVLTSRGSCPYRCPFCSASHLWEGKRRMRPASDIIDELRYLINTFGAAKLFFVDDIFTLNSTWTKKLLALLIKERETHPGFAELTWGCATRVDLVDEELLDLMAEAGCNSIQYGVESGAQSILDSVKGIEREQVIESIEHTVARGIDALCSFMIPFPEDTEATLRESAEFMRTLQDKGAKLLLSYTTPYPGTQFYELAEELGITILDDNWESYDAKRLVFETRYLKKDAIEELIRDIVADLELAKS